MKSLDCSHQTHNEGSCPQKVAITYFLNSRTIWNQTWYGCISSKTRVLWERFGNLSKSKAKVRVQTLCVCPANVFWTTGHVASRLVVSVRLLAQDCLACVEASIVSQIATGVTGSATDFLSQCFPICWLIVTCTDSDGI